MIFFQQNNLFLHTHIIGKRGEHLIGFFFSGGTSSLLIRFLKLTIVAVSECDSASRVLVHPTTDAHSSSNDHRGLSFVFRVLVAVLLHMTVLSVHEWLGRGEVLVSTL